MSKKEILIREIKQFPEPFIDEALNFVRFKKAKGVKEGTNTDIASESSLAKDWLKSEEDESWKNL